MRYKLVEKELDVPGYRYSKEFDTHEEAYEKMKMRYHDLIKDGCDGDGPISNSEICGNSAYVEMADDNIISWDIYEIH